MVLAQEPGHNFGMQHSSALRCPGKTFVDDPTGACTHIEYGDVFDPMGSGCRHTNGWQKQYQGWLGGCNSVRLSASGTFTLLPLESPCDGIQMLQIPMAHTRNFSYTGMSGFGSGATVDELTYYYVELRAQAAGFDQGLAPQVQVRAGGDYRPAAQSGLHTWLLDMNPATSTFTDAALAVGRTFTDPAGGVTITATAVTPTSATIAVTIEGGDGVPTCLDGTTIVPPGPSSCAGTGAGGTGSLGSGRRGWLRWRRPGRNGWRRRVARRPPWRQRRFLRRGRRLPLPGRPDRVLDRLCPSAGGGAGARQPAATKPASPPRPDLGRLQSMMISM